MPLFDIFITLCELFVGYLRADVGQLLEDRHYNILYETRLAACDICCFSITHHRDLESLGLFYVTLIEKLFKQETSPILTDFKFSKRGTDITSMQKHTGDE